jgi:hypothetical protein
MPRSRSTEEGGSIGAYLKRQRKLRGLSLADLESATRVPKRSLERLESGAYDGIPDGFARGFVRTVAGAIGLDPEETVSRMLVEPEWVGEGKTSTWGTLAWVGGGVVIVAGLLLVMVGGIRASQSAAPDQPDGAGTLRRFDAVRALATELGIEPRRARPAAPEGLAHEIPALADDPDLPTDATPSEPALELPPLPPRARQESGEAGPPKPLGPHPAEVPSAAN